MPHTISHRTTLPLLAGACALAISFAPALAAGGGSHMGAMPAPQAPMARPMPAPVDTHPTPAPGARDISSHARFDNLTTSPPTTGSTDISSHAQEQRTPTPVTGTRIIIAPSAPRLDPPPH
jgi:hypothetical protein